jgi:hypothetical protein
MPRFRDGERKRPCRPIHDFQPDNLLSHDYYSKCGSGRGHIIGREKIMTTVKGLIFIKQGRIGTRSEGPDYYIQTKESEFPLARKTETNLFEPDYLLEYYCRKWVTI